MSTDSLDLSIPFAMTLGNLFESHGLIIKSDEIASTPYGSFNNAIMLHGNVKLQSNIITQLVVFITGNWSLIPPRIICSEKWLRRESDWHIYENGELCYVLPDEWKDTIQENITRHGVRYAIEMGTVWCYDNVVDLLNKHWIAYCDGLITWPQAWPAWKHGEDGIKQYECEKNVNKNKRK